MRMLRRATLAAALAAMLFASWVWYADGAWHYGAMPTTGMIRVGLLGIAAIACVAAARWVERRHRLNAGGETPY